MTTTYHGRKSPPIYKPFGAPEPEEQMAKGSRKLLEAIIMTERTHGPVDMARLSALGISSPFIPPQAPPKSHMRVSSDSAWPLRRADGRTWAESAK